MESVLNGVDALFTQGIEWFGAVLNMIGTEPILQIMCIGVVLVGFAIGGTKRLLRV